LVKSCRTAAATASRIAPGSKRFAAADRVFRNGAGIIPRTPRKGFPDPRGEGIDIFAVKLCLTGSSACTQGFAAVGVAKALRFRAFNGFRLG